MSGDKLYVRICSECGQTFHSHQRHALYCSEECSTRQKTHTCKICGKTFITHRDKALYCSKPCFQESQRRQASVRGVEVVRMHDEKGMTFQEIGNEYGVTKARAFQLYQDQKERDVTG